MTSLADIPAIRQGLQIDQDAAAVEGRVGAVDADKRRQAFDRGILQNRLAPTPAGAPPWRQTRSLCGASEMPRITPVSCTGKNPLGI